MANNGQPFTATPNIPIVGQRFVLEGYLVQILLTCKCDHPRPVMIIGRPGQAAGQCPSCQTVWGLKAFSIDPRTHQPAFELAMSKPPAAPLTPVP